MSAHNFSKPIRLLGLMQLLAVICLQFPAVGQWREIARPEGAAITALFIHGDHLFAGTNNGIIRSTDHGQSWKIVKLGNADTPISSYPSISSFTAIGETIFASSRDCGILRSSDHGQTWELLDVFGEVTSIAAVGTDIFAGLKGGAPHAVLPTGIIRSTDNGRTWSRVGQGTADGSIHTLTAIGTELFAGKSYGALRSSDRGNSWTKIDASIATRYGSDSNIDFRTFAVIGTRLFAGTNNGVFVSTDQGMSWRLINQGLPSYQKNDRWKPVRTLAVKNDTLFAGTSGFGVFQFNSQLQSWTESNNGLLGRDVSAFAVSDDKIIVGTDAGISISTDNGESWKSSNSGIYQAGGGFAVIGNRLFTKIGSILYASADNGNSWAPTKESIDSEEVQIPAEWVRGSLNTDVVRMASIDGVIIAGTRGGIFRSIDGGQNWDEANQGLPPGERGMLAPAIDLLAVIGKEIYAGIKDNGLFFSTDQGLSWTETSRDLRDMTVIGLVPVREKLFAATVEDGIFVSLDRGRHWRKSGADFSEKDIYALAGISGHLLAWTSDGIYLSTDEGRNWIASGIGRDSQNAYRFAVSGGKIFAGIKNELLVSADQGRSWTKLGIIPEGEIFDLAVSGNQIIASTHRGVFRSTDEGRSWKQVGSLQQVYTWGDNTLRNMYSIASNGTRILAGGDFGRIYLSPDLGETWMQVTAGVNPPNNFITRNLVLKVTVAGIPNLIAGTDAGLYISSNRGQTWRPTGIFYQVTSLRQIGSIIIAVAGGRPFISRDNGMSWVAALEKGLVVNAFAGKHDRIYIIAESIEMMGKERNPAQDGLYVSTDVGRSWTPIKDGLTDSGLTALGISNTHIYVVDRNGRIFARRF
jgi:photosystem II stability/assembly factor-like uncharacterized protein